MLAQRLVRLQLLLRVCRTSAYQTLPRRQISSVKKTCAVSLSKALQGPGSMHSQTVPKCRTQEQAAKIDEELMGPLGFSVDQLMELAGLSVAQAVHSEFPPQSHASVLVIAGPGNNGGDGLVAARHLHQFGYKPQVCYPKQTDKPLYRGLVTQLESLGIPFVTADDLRKQQLTRFDLVLDAMFGFSFKGAPRPPFDALLEMLKPGASPPTIASVDSPSGWHVEKGDEAGDGLRPHMLVSLTAPKLGAQSFKGPFHYLGGRFVPPGIAERYKLKLPAFPGASQCVRIPSGQQDSAGTAGLRQSYEQGGLLEQDADADAVQQFDKWFKEAVECKSIKEPNACALGTARDVCPHPERTHVSVRMVLLKGYSQQGFVFYSNYHSRKGSQLEQNPQAALCFWWEHLERSVRIEGSVEQVSREESSKYFHSRPRGSQLGALASRQSAQLSGREELEQQYCKLEEEYADESREIPMPDNWGGYRLLPHRIEFWHGRPSRLHDRLLYIRQDSRRGWERQRLSP